MVEDGGVAGDLLGRRRQQAVRQGRHRGGGRTDRQDLRLVVVPGHRGARDRGEGEDHEQERSTHEGSPGLRVWRSSARSRHAEAAGDGSVGRRPQGQRGRLGQGLDAVPEDQSAEFRRARVRRRGDRRLGADGGDRGGNGHGRGRLLRRRGIGGGRPDDDQALDDPRFGPTRQQAGLADRDGRQPRGDRRPEPWTAGPLGRGPAGLEHQAVAVEPPSGRRERPEGVLETVSLGVVQGFGRRHGTPSRARSASSPA